MGCSLEREKHIDFVESTIQSAENQFQFQNIHCSNFDLSFSRFASGNVLSEQQLKAAIEELNLRMEELEENNFRTYLRWMTDQNEEFSLKKLVCVGILLGNGDQREKGNLLMQNYDRDCSGEIDAEEFKAFFRDLIQISVNAAIDIAKKSSSSMTLKLDEYGKRMKKAEKNLEDYVYFIMSMGKDDEIIKKDDFLHTFDDKKLKKLTTTQGIRELLSEFSEKLNNI